MTTYPRIFGRRSRYVDSEHPTYRPIYDLVDRDIFGANHGTVFPVVVRCLQRQEWRVFTYALVQGEQQGWFAGHKVDPEGVFYFTPYRDIGDQLTNPTDRRKAWFKNIRNVVKAHEMPHVIEENDDDIQLTGFRSLQPASMTNSEENQAREATIQQTLEGELGQDSRSMDETHVTTPWLRPRKRPRASRRRLLRVSPELDTDTSSSSSPESGPSPVREASPIRAVRPVDDSRAMRRGRPVRGRIPMGGSTPNTGSSTTASATASQPPASIPQLDHSCRHGSDTQAEKLRDMLRDHIGSLRGLIRTAKRSDGPASSRSGAETTWLESFHEAVEEMELQRSESDLNTIVEFTHDFQGVLRTTVRRARKRGRTADGLPVANEAFLNAIDEEIENISQARLESGL
ncbi:hypothetical protein KVT40_008304 [Elsinoe batatas]|uniref:Uncharacterized protein n=1 Tax=Elsinoe batatas TaxID=2601811 RepID=A0A8K0KVD6_9PEZI|nr:hypothetical protein KVT40_008304 [Elsinoe batatas]